MSFFGKRRADVEPEVRQRDKLIEYKKTFSGEQGREVLFDLLNRFHLLEVRELTKFEEGQRSVVVDILTRCNVDLVQFDKILKGEFQ